MCARLSDISRKAKDGVTFQARTTTNSVRSSASRGYSAVAITFDDGLEQQVSETLRCFGMDIQKGRNLLPRVRHSEIETYPSQPFGSSSPDKLLLEDSIL